MWDLRTPNIKHKTVNIFNSNRFIQATTATTLRLREPAVTPIARIKKPTSNERNFNQLWVKAIQQSQ